MASFLNSTGLTQVLNAVKAAIPTKVSDLLNDTGFTTNTGTLTGVSFNGTPATVASGVAAITASVPTKHFLPASSNSDLSFLDNVNAGDIIVSTYEGESHYYTAGFKEESPNYTYLELISIGSVNGSTSVQLLPFHKENNAWTFDSEYAYNDNFEVISNKVSQITAASTYDQYPSAAAVWNLVSNAIDFDTVPTENSTKPVTSGGLYTVITNNEYVVASAINRLDDRITNLAIPNVPAWALATTKPSYTLDEVLDGTTRYLPKKIHINLDKDFLYIKPAGRGIWQITTTYIDNQYSNSTVKLLAIVTPSGELSQYSSYNIEGYVFGDQDCPLNLFPESNSNTESVGLVQESTCWLRLEVSHIEEEYADVEGYEVVEKSIDLTVLEGPEPLEYFTSNDRTPGSGSWTWSGNISWSMIAESSYIEYDSSSHYLKSYSLSGYYGDNIVAASTLVRDGGGITGITVNGTPATITNGVAAITAAGGDTNVIESITFNGSTVPITNKVANITATIPTTLDQISDGSTRKLADYLPLAGGQMNHRATLLFVSDESSTTSTGYLYNILINPLNGIYCDCYDFGNFVHLDVDSVWGYDRHTTYTAGGIIHGTIENDYSGTQDTSYEIAFPEKNGTFAVIEYTSNAHLPVLNINYERTSSNIYHAGLSSDKLTISGAGEADGLIGDGIVTTHYKNAGIEYYGLDNTHAELWFPNNNVSGIIAVTSDIPTESTVLGWGFTKNAGTLTGVTFNGTAATVTNGVAAITASIPTESTVSGWGFTKNTGTYSKPSGGIPASDMTLAVQTSLGKADKIPSISSSDSQKLLVVDSDGNISAVFAVGASGIVHTIANLQSYSIVGGDCSNFSFIKPSDVNITLQDALDAKGTYSKPSGGIPATDLASAVQTSLGKADTALQSFTETDPIFLASAASGITSTNISTWNGKQDAISDLATIRSNASAGAAKVSANNSTITIQKNGTQVDTFTLNQSSNKSVNIQINELPTVTASDNGKVLQVVSGAWSLVTPVSIYSGSATPSNSVGNNGDIYVQT